MTARTIRRAAAILAAVVLTAPATALAMPAPDGFYDSGGSSARWYALFWNGAFVSEVHFKGCTSEIPIAQVRQADGSYKATAPGAARGGPCVVGLGLNMSGDFRSAIASALKSGPAPAGFAVVEVVAGKATTELAGTGYISDVTVGGGAGLVEVEIVPTSGTPKRTAASASRSLGTAGIHALDPAQTALTLDGKPFGSGTTIEPVAFKRADDRTGTTTTAGGLELAPPLVGVPPSAAVATTIDQWFASALTGPVTTKPVTAVFKSAAGHTLTVRLDAFPARWEPYPVGGRRRLLLGAGATPLELS